MTNLLATRIDLPNESLQLPAQLDLGYISDRDATIKANLLKSDPGHWMMFIEELITSSLWAMSMSPSVKICNVYICGNSSFCNVRGSGRGTGGSNSCTSSR